MFYLFFLFFLVIFAIFMVLVFVIIIKGINKKGYNGHKSHINAMSNNRYNYQNKVDDNIESGIKGEAETAYQLKFVGNEYRVINGRYVFASGERQEFDHIVVGPNGVFHIDSKNYAGNITFTENGMIRDEGRSNVDPTAQMYRHEFILKELLQNNNIDADVTGIICFTNPACNIYGKSPAFETLRVDRLLHFIKSYQATKSMTQDDVTRIAQVILTNSKPSDFGYEDRHAQ